MKCGGCFVDLFLMQESAKRFIKIMLFTSYLFNKLSQYKEFYETEDEFVKHLMSGEVKIPIPDLIKIQSSYQCQFLPSHFQLHDKARLCFNKVDSIPVKVNGVHFFSGKVKYDLEVEIPDEVTTRIYNVDSCFVLSK
jgi:hypothetical protein